MRTIHNFVMNENLIYSYILVCISKIQNLILYLSVKQFFENFCFKNKRYNLGYNYCFKFGKQKIHEELFWHNIKLIWSIFPFNRICFSSRKSDKHVSFIWIMVLKI